MRLNQNLLKTNNQFIFSTRVIGYPLLFVLLIWLVFWVEIRFGFDFNYLGIRPRNLIGLRGIVLSPFIHANIKHLFSNSLPLVILSMALFYFYRNISWKILIYGLLLTGFLTWLIGRPANHIGASGVIYLLASFLFFKGIFSRFYRLMALSFIVVFSYGGMMWFVMPVDPSISWEGHLSGFVVGLVFAVFYKQQIVEQPKYDWEQPDYNEENDLFMSHFDADGNFVEHKDEPEILEPKYHYIYKKTEEE